MRRACKDGLLELSLLSLKIPGQILYHVKACSLRTEYITKISAIDEHRARTAGLGEVHAIASGDSLDRNTLEGHQYG